MNSPSFRRGLDAVHDTAKTSGGGFSRLHFFNIKDGESAVLRFLTDYDQLVYVEQHNMVPTRPAPEGYSGNWPAVTTAICRRDPAFSSMGYSDCFICDRVMVNGKPAKPATRYWGLAVLREEVMEGGKIVGYRDAVRRVAEVKDGKPTGNEIEEKAIVLVNMAYRNFFNTLENYFSYWGTILDRDLVVKRSGAKTDTTYSFLPLNPIPLGDGRNFDLREPDLMARYEPLPDLVKILTDRSSDDYYHRFFDTRFKQPSFNSGNSASVDEPEPVVKQPETDISADQLEAIARRVKGIPASDSGAPTVGGEMRAY